MPLEVNAHAMLLRVIAHDLLSPLTAIKWQAELLGNPTTSHEKREAYLASIRSTTEIGISITKHAHVAGSVLTATYVQEEAPLILSDLIVATCTSLKSQFERHGIHFEWDAARSEETVLDSSLASLLVWAVAKFFLASVSMNGTVRVLATTVSRDDGPVYEVTYCTSDAIEPEALARMFGTRTPRTALDQEYVFAFLVHEVARSLGTVSVSATYDQGMFSIRSDLPFRPKPS